MRASRVVASGVSVHDITHRGHFHATCQPETVGGSKGWWAPPGQHKQPLMSMEPPMGATSVQHTVLLPRGAVEVLPNGVTKRRSGWACIGNYQMVVSPSKYPPSHPQPVFSSGALDRHARVLQTLKRWCARPGQAGTPSIGLLMQSQGRKHTRAHAHHPNRSQGLRRGAHHGGH